ncbi:MAG: hypothetical protein ABW082_17980 [Sedimenticola sp.]
MIRIKQIDDPVIPELEEAATSQTSTLFSFNGEDTTERYSELWDMSRYTSVKPFLPPSPLGGLFSPLEATNSNMYQSIPEGWREIDHTQLGMPESALDSKGYYRASTGLVSMDGQALVFGKYDESDKLTEIAVAFRGTTSLGDVAAYVENLDAYQARTGFSYTDGFDDLLHAVKEHAMKNGLASTDVGVTGYSLGGAAVNDMYTNREENWDGFYKDSLFFGNAPCFVKEGENILNFGFENDTVHRAWLDGSDLKSTLLHMIDNKDVDFESSTDNMVLFSELYALGLHAPLGAFSWFDPLSWEAHLQAAAMNPVDIIGSSNFYDQMSEDSRIVISNLMDFTRDFIWVKDKDSPSTSNADRSEGFVLGTDDGDRIADRSDSNDFLDGFGGNDLFKISGGDDTVHGGDGYDTVMVKGKLSDYSFARDEEGTVYMEHNSGKYGLDTLIDVEAISFKSSLFQRSHKVAVTEDGLVTTSRNGSTDIRPWDEYEIGPMDTFQVI